MSTIQILEQIPKMLTGEDGDEVLRSVTIPSDDARNLISLLKNPDPTIVGAASQVIAHFTPNDQFRHYFLQTEIWNVFSDLLRRQQGPKAALQMLVAFAGHKDTRALIINSKFGIVNELLNMLKAGSSDFDRWEVGLKGLLALEIGKAAKNFEDAPAAAGEKAGYKIESSGRRSCTESAATVESLER
ncbi:hypothetical protein DFH09DRAFT_1111234 [Mycena vulgaris]|nr:hypothetical protein DFH09DRAFT_1111234 [Mycena vulgaris]